MAEENVTTRFEADITDFKSSMQEASRVIRLANSEFEAMSSSLDENASEQDKLALAIKKQTKLRDAEKRKLETLRAEYEKVAAEQGEGSRAAQELAIKINNQTASLNKAEKALSGYKEQLDEVNKSSEKSGGGFGKLANGFKSIAAGAGKAAAGAIKGVAVAAAGAVTSFLALAESTREYRTELGKLETSFTTAGHSAETANKVYKEMYGVLGDSGKATEASQQLAQLAKTEEDLNQWTDILTGAYATFGDALPVESLAEAANETAKTGQITGALADSLNWLGVSEEEFQSKLDAANTEQERAAIITDTLNGLYGEAANQYKEVNKDIIAANEAQANLTDTMAELGAIAEPITTALKNLAAEGLQKLLPLMQSLADAFTHFFNGDYSAGTEIITNLFNGLVEKGEELFTKVVDKVSELIPVILPKIAEFLGVLLDKIIEFLPTLLDGAIKLFSAIVDAIPPTIKALLKKLPEIISNLLKFLVENYPKIVKAGYELLGKLIAGIIDCIPDLIAAVIELVGKMIKTFMETDWGEVGKDILDGILEGLKNVGSSIKKAVKEVGGKIKKEFKEFFDINSPSKVMADEVGKYLALGIGEGFEKNIEGVTKGMVSSMGGLTDDLSVNVNGKGKGSSVYNLNYTVNSPKPINRYENWQQSKKMMSLLKGGAV